MMKVIICIELKILLTGGSGMVGRNFLENKESNIFTIISPSRSQLDLKDFSETKNFIEKIQPDLVLHAAGLVGGIQANISAPLEFFLDNLTIGKNVILACKEIKVKKLINLGSSCMYPRNKDSGLLESEVFSGDLEPTNEGYALAKIVVAKLCEYIYNTESEFQYKTIIPCNLYGKYDKYDPDNSHLIPSIIHKVHQAKARSLPVIDIWGDGSAKREFMYASDFADALVYCLKNFESIPPVLNIGLGFDYTITEYYQTAAKVLGFNGRFEYDLSRPSGMKRKLLDITLLKSLGWEAKTNLTDGILATYNDYLLTHA